MSSAAPTLRALVAGLVDYAGLFPPASLGMAEAAANYSSYLASSEAWMLGRFVVPVARLGELAEAASRVGTTPPTPWRVAAIGGGDPAADGDAVRAHDEPAGRLVVDVVEHRLATVD